MSSNNENQRPRDTASSAATKRVFPTLSSSPPIIRSQDQRHLPILLSRTGSSQMNNCDHFTNLNNNSNIILPNSSHTNLMEYYHDSYKEQTPTPEPILSYDETLGSESTGTAMSESALNPILVHRWTYSHSILSIAASPSHGLLFCGTQDSKILIFDLITYQKKAEIKAHHGSVLCLLVSDDEDILFSGGSDSLVKVWQICNLEEERNHEVDQEQQDQQNQEQQEESNAEFSFLEETYTIYSLMDIGDIFSIAWCRPLQTVFIGSQNASISYVHLNTFTKHKVDPSSMPAHRYDKFFDSKGPGGNMLPIQNERKNSIINSKLIEIQPENVILYAHYGYVYSLISFENDEHEHGHYIKDIPSEYTTILLSGGGDGNVKIWGVKDSNGLSKGEIKIDLLKTLENEESVLSMTHSKSYLYCGLSEGNLKVWDLSTLQQIRHCESDEGDIVSLATVGDCLFKGTKKGVTKWKFRGEKRTDWVAHDNQYALCVKTMIMNNKYFILTAGMDHSIALWNVNALAPSHHCEEVSQQLPSLALNGSSPTSSLSNNLLSLSTDNIETFKGQIGQKNYRLVEILEELVSFKTVSKNPELFLNESRSCANYIRRLCKSLGAKISNLLPVENGNPVVHVEFQANKINENVNNNNNFKNGLNPRILWYGHYDVIEVEDYQQWSSDPFKLNALNGYLYGRGVTDNKGPLVASLLAVAELFEKNELTSDVVFLIEGEEESGSFGFQKVVNNYKDMIGDFDWILLSNSYWLDDNIPCLNYGLRGVISLQVEIWGDKPDRHSGVDGGISREPTIDLINTLSKLNDEQGKVKIPNFYESVKPVNEDELKLYENIIERCSNLDNLTINELMSKWRLPSLTIHKFEVSGPGNSTVIPQSAKAAISIRIVPDQDIEEIKKNIVNYIENNFNKLKTENHLKVKFLHEAEPWLADTNNDAYKILNEEVTKEWKIEPLFIREGGSIPSVRFLEKTFKAPAAHLPCGQSSDNAHLNNERLRVLNFYKTHNILKNVFVRLPCRRN
ncbi:unnamed protein product [[Candida] boidinii]|uniref:Unnamed protein product n=1 Tax=Candida boidinii TaxID=5477 RepID=A0ACB5TL85_CANBO|nr:unnamed protein product [[Candida] boidinii]